MPKRAKKMPREEFEEVMQREWHPVELTGDAIPTFLQGIPEERLHKIVASGVPVSGMVYKSEIIPSGNLIGGIDVYRNAPDDPVELNKDWYAVIRVPHTDTLLLVEGPIKDEEHWIDEVPRRLNGAEILGIPKKTNDEPCSEA